MPSKKSKKTSHGSKQVPTLWKVARTCAESELEQLASFWVRELGPQDVVLLRGEMGSGKSTFAQAILKQMGVDRPAEGSPTFSLMHEYRGRNAARIVHIDLYRLETIEEIRDSGIEAAIWEDRAFALIEWAERFPGFFESEIGPGRALWEVRLAFVPEEPLKRSIEIVQLSER